MPAGYSGTPLPRKLGIRPDARVATLGAPEHFPQLLEPLPDGVSLYPDPSGSTAHDVIVAFAPDTRTLATLLPRAHELLDRDGGLWIAWPKKSSPLHRDLAREPVREAGLATGLVDNKVCAIDDDWSALRFVYRLEDR